MAKRNVLFLCTGNSARSQMAEALLRSAAGDQFEVHSAGLQPKGVNPYTIRVMDELGISIRDQWSKNVDEYMKSRMFLHFVITVCSDADKACPQALWIQNGIKLHWPFADPAAVEGTDEEKMAAFRAVRDQIKERIQLWLQEPEAQEAHA